MITRIRRILVKKRLKYILSRLAEKQFKKEDVLYFDTAEDAYKWGQETFASWITNIEAHRGQEYVVKSERYLKTPYQAIQYYCGYVHEKVNAHLRYGEPEKPLSYVTDIIYWLDEEFKSSIIPVDLVVVRWVRKDSFKSLYGNALKGTTIVDKGYMSSSLHLFYESPHDFGELDIENCVLMVIKVPKGSRGLFLCPVSGRHHEQEILLCRNTSLEVIQVKKTIFGSEVLVCILN